MAVAPGPDGAGVTACPFGEGVPPSLSVLYIVLYVDENPGVPDG